MTKDYLSSEARIQNMLLEVFDGHKSRTIKIRKDYYTDNSPVQHHKVIKREVIR